MKTQIRMILVSLFFCAILSACGPSQADLDASATQVAENNYAAQAAQIPTATSTSVPTATATSTSTPTATLVPTATPNQAATAMAATHSASLATEHARQAATAVSALATQKAEDAVWAQLVSDGSITYKKGALYTVDDFEQSWAQLDWYKWWSFGYNMSDFVIMTNVEWAYPKDWTLGGGGCGFAIRIKDNDNHLLIFLTPQSSAYLGAMSPRGFKLQTYHWQNPNNPNFSLVPYETTGKADFTVVAEKEFITAYVNGVKIYQWYVALTSSGDMGYTILSGTNKDFGTDCKFTNTRVWELIKQ